MASLVFVSVSLLGVKSTCPGTHWNFKSTTLHVLVISSASSSAEFHCILWFFLDFFDCSVDVVKEIVGWFGTLVAEGMDDRLVVEAYEDGSG